MLLEAESEPRHTSRMSSRGDDSLSVSTVLTSEDASIEEASNLKQLSVKVVLTLCPLLNPFYYLHTYIHSFIQVHIHTYIHLFRQPRVCSIHHTHIHAYIHTYIFYIRFPNENNYVTVGHESSARLADRIALILLNILIRYGMCNMYVCMYSPICACMRPDVYVCMYVCVDLSADICLNVL